MTSARWMLVKRLLQEALERPAEERSAFLERAVRGDGALRREVEELLAANDLADGFLETPPRALSLDDAPGETPDALVGRTLDGLYRIDALLGQGGMGVVYRARHELLGDRVAIKMIASGLSANADLLDRFVREGKAARRFRHPNAVSVFDLRVADEGAYLVLEYVEGRTLRSELQQRGRLAPGDVVELLVPVASALDAAHASGVVHRDVKPDNVMLGDRPGDVKVLDFGVAKLRELADDSSDATPPASTSTSAGVVLGTAIYMSPEQWGASSRDGVPGVDGRADVYSLGVMAFELVCGGPPFVGDNVGEIRCRHLSADPPLAHERVADVPVAFGLALARAIAKDRADRPASAGEFVGDLRRALGRAASATADAGTAETSISTPEPPNNLPRLITRFVGRSREVADVRAALASERLVTLNGMGGIGKTRLAIEAAFATLGDFPDGVWLVELAAVTEAALVSQAVARALGVTEEAKRPVLDSVAARLRTARALLVLDNCEHVIDASASTADALLRACPDVRVLATSREALSVAGEAIYSLDPLPTPDADEGVRADRLLALDSVRLFVDRVRSHRPTFGLTEPNAAAVAAICRRLDGIPLALELAAARARLLTVEEILVRLDDVFALLVAGGRTAPTRQQTLRATLDWSYNLLTASERELFGRLAVFAGGWTLDAAEVVAGPTGDADGNGGEGSVFDVLARLVDKSLVVTHERGSRTRYAMLEIVREYAIERLRATGAEVGARRLHAEWSLALAEEISPGLTLPNAAEGLARIATEHDNFRTALAWLLGHDPVPCARLVVALQYYWSVRGHLAEGRRWLEATLDTIRAGPPSICAKALRGLGYMAGEQGDLAAARAFFEEALEIARRIGDSTNAAWASLGVGRVTDFERDLDAARAAFEETLALGRELASDLLIAEGLNALGDVARAEGDLAAARGCYGHALTSFRSAGSDVGVSAALANLGFVALDEDEWRAAQAHLAEALVIAESLGEKHHLSAIFDALGAVASRRRAWARAARIGAAADALREANGYVLALSERAFRDQYMTPVRAALGDEAVDAAAAEGRSYSLDRAVAYALEDSETE